MNTIPSDAKHELRIKHANRADLGFLLWRNRQNDDEGRFFSYEETIAAAALLLWGYSIADAATLVDRDIVVALPHVSGLDISDLVGDDFAYTLGMVRFTDGSIWEVLADLDIDVAESAVSEYSPLYQAVATRNLEPSPGESMMHRVEQLLTLGRIDRAGRFVRRSGAVSIAA